MTEDVNFEQALKDLELKCEEWQKTAPLAPPTWVPLAGQQLSVAEYPELFEFCVREHGAENGDGLFTLPAVTIPLPFVEPDGTEREGVAYSIVRAKPSVFGHAVGMALSPWQNGSGHIPWFSGPETAPSLPGCGIIHEVDDGPPKEVVHEELASFILSSLKEKGGS